MKLKRFKERDNKKIGVIVFTLVCLFLISGAILYRTFAIFEVRTNQNVIKGKVGDMGDIQFAFYIDDNIVKTAPSASDKEKYVFDEEKSNCTNEASVYWDYQRWGPNVSNLTQTKTKCYLKFRTEYNESILNGAVPKLKEELTPVILEEDGTVKRADTTTSWYNYGSQKWANAVITGNSYDLLGSDVHGAEKQNGYVHFDGKDDYIDLGFENHNFGKNLTVAITTSQLNNDKTAPSIIGNQENGGFAIAAIPNTIYGSIHDGTEYKKVQCQISSFTESHTFILKYDGQTLNLYIDGTVCNSLSLSTDITLTPTPIFIGANPGQNGYHENFADINVKQAAIFDRAIGEDEIASISNNFKITNGEGLLKYVDFTNKKYETGEVISEDNIESYFVWIPRYKYQIWNGEEETSKFTQIEKDLGDIENATEKPELNQAKEIKIEFENKHMPVSNGTLKNEWLTHPAFTSFDSDGFWVGKFETGYKGATSATEAQQSEKDSTKVIIKPNVYSWRNVNVLNAFSTSKEYKLTLDSHMMKNMEWGAVAYLTNSQYGRCKDNKCEEVRINNSKNYVTGSSAKNEPTCGYTGTSTDCNKYGESTPSVDNAITWNYKNKESVKSSTTNNYYGIYDIAGGAWETPFFANHQQTPVKC